LKELKVGYVAENYQKIESTNAVLYWNVEDKKKLLG